MTDITYLRLYADEPGSGTAVRLRRLQAIAMRAATYAAIRSAELAVLMADPPANPEVVTLDLPDSVVAMLRMQLSTPLQRAVIIIGTVTDGVWITGPLAGEPAPDSPPCPNCGQPAGSGLHASESLSDCPKWVAGKGWVGSTSERN